MNIFNHSIELNKVRETGFFFEQKILSLQLTNSGQIEKIDMAIKITCINKDNGNHENPYVAITDLGWVNELKGTSGRNTRLEIYNWIKDDNGEAYVKDAQGNKAALITAETPKGTKYVKTEADTSLKNNLLSLEECK